MMKPKKISKWILLVFSITNLTSSGCFVDVERALLDSASYLNEFPGIFPKDDGLRSSEDTESSNGILKWDFADERAVFNRSGIQMAHRAQVRLTGLERIGRKLQERFDVTENNVTQRENSRLKIRNVQLPRSLSVGRYTSNVQIGRENNNRRYIRIDSTFEKHRQNTLTNKNRNRAEEFREQRINLQSNTRAVDKNKIGPVPRLSNVVSGKMSDGPSRRFNSIREERGRLFIRSRSENTKRFQARRESISEKILLGNTVETMERSRNHISRMPERKTLTRSARNVESMKYANNVLRKIARAIRERTEHKVINENRNFVAPQENNKISDEIINIQISGYSERDQNGFIKQKSSVTTSWRIKDNLRSVNNYFERNKEMNRMFRESKTDHREQFEAITNRKDARSVRERANDRLTVATKNTVFKKSSRSIYEHLSEEKSSNAKNFRQQNNKSVLQVRVDRNEKQRRIDDAKSKGANNSDRNLYRVTRRENNAISVRNVVQRMSIETISKTSNSQEGNNLRIRMKRSEKQRSENANSKRSLSEDRNLRRMTQKERNVISERNMRQRLPRERISATRNFREENILQVRNYDEKLRKMQDINVKFFKKGRNFRRMTQREENVIVNHSAKNLIQKVSTIRNCREERKDNFIHGKMDRNESQRRIDAIKSESSFNGNRYFYAVTRIMRNISKYSERSAAQGTLPERKTITRNSRREIKEDILRIRTNRNERQKKIDGARTKRSLNDDKNLETIAVKEKKEISDNLKNVRERRSTERILDRSFREMNRESVMKRNEKQRKSENVQSRSSFNEDRMRTRRASNGIPSYMERNTVQQMSTEIMSTTRNFREERKENILRTRMERNEKQRKSEEIKSKNSLKEDKIMRMMNRRERNALSNRSERNDLQRTSLTRYSEEENELRIRMSRNEKQRKTEDIRSKAFNEDRNLRMSIRRERNVISNPSESNAVQRNHREDYNVLRITVNRSKKQRTEDVKSKSSLNGDKNLRREVNDISNNSGRNVREEMSTTGNSREENNVFHQRRMERNEKQRRTDNIRIKSSLTEDRNSHSVTRRKRNVILNPSEKKVMSTERMSTTRNSREGNKGNILQIRMERDEEIKSEGAKIQCSFHEERNLRFKKERNTISSYSERSNMRRMLRTRNSREKHDENILQIRMERNVMQRISKGRLLTPGNSREGNILQVRNEKQRHAEDVNSKSSLNDDNTLRMMTRRERNVILNNLDRSMMPRVSTTRSSREANENMLRATMDRNEKQRKTEDIKRKIFNDRNLRSMTRQERSFISKESMKNAMQRVLSERMSAMRSFREENKENINRTSNEKQRNTESLKSKLDETQINQRNGRGFRGKSAQRTSSRRYNHRESSLSVPACKKNIPFCEQISKTIENNQHQTGFIHKNVGYTRNIMNHQEDTVKWMKRIGSEQVSASDLVTVYRGSMSYQSSDSENNVKQNNRIQMDSAPQLYSSSEFPSMPTSNIFQKHPTPARIPQEHNERNWTTVSKGNVFSTIVQIILGLLLLSATSDKQPIKAKHIGQKFLSALFLKF